MLGSIGIKDCRQPHYHSFVLFCQPVDPLVHSYSTEGIFPLLLVYIHCGKFVFFFPNQHGRRESKSFTKGQPTSRVPLRNTGIEMCAIFVFKIHRNVRQECPAKCRHNSEKQCLVNQLKNLYAILHEKLHASFPRIFKI